MTTLRIATRKSRLALWQAEWIRNQILQQFPDLPIILVELTTQGDLILHRSLAEIGGKGLFIKELEQALLAGKADLAVHSMKDITAFVPKGLSISVITEREHPGDAFVSEKYTKLATLPHNAIIGTSSLRRACQIKHIRPDLIIRTLRGNVETRLHKLDKGEYDAIILAVAGLRRLGLEHRITQIIPQTILLPAIAQGIIGIETRINDSTTLSYLQHLQHEETALCFAAERKVLELLEGNCRIPLAGYCHLQQGKLHLEARIGSPDGSQLYQAIGEAPPSQAHILGEQIADQLLQQGGQEILQEFA